MIPNQNLFRLANEKTGWGEAFKMADHVLYMGVRGVTDLMVTPGLVNLDFADIRAVMAEMGKAMMGTGEADGDNRAVRASEAAISNPLLEDTSMAGARGLLINITGGEDMTLYEVDQAANRIREEVDEDANIIFGSAIDPALAGRIRVSVVATGIETPGASSAQRPRLVAVGGASVGAVAEVDQAQEPAQLQAAAQPLMAVAGRTAARPAFGGVYAEAPAQSFVQHASTASAPALLRQPTAERPNSSYETPAAPAAPRGLFAEQQPRPAAAATHPPRASLFSIVTDVFRRSPPEQPLMPGSGHPGQDAAHRPDEPQAAVRQATPEDAIDIPAFLRRQS